MKRYSEKQIRKIKKIRQENGYSFVQLSNITGVPQTTIRNWCYKDDVHTKWDTLRATNERKRLAYKNSETHALSRLKSMKPYTAKILASIMYWCEGAKYPSSNRMNIANSDIDFMKTFIYLLRIGFVLDESKFSVHLQIHDTHDYERIKLLWSKKLNIPPERFIRPTITSANGKKRRNNYPGTCNLNYRDYKLQLKLIGLYEAFAKKFG